MIAVKRQYLWAQHYAEMVEKSIGYYNYINQLQPVYTRPLEQEEADQIFGGNPDYIKNIGRKTDGKEWKLLERGNKSESNVY